MKSRKRLHLSNQRKWIFLSILMILFLLIAWAIVKSESFWLDRMIFAWIDKIHTPWMTTLFKMITGLVSVPALILFSILIYCHQSTRKQGNVVILNLTLVYILNYGLKLIFARERPFGISLIEETGYSFPSGHSMISMAYFGLFIYLIYHSNFTKKKKGIIISLLGFLIFLIGISRIYLGVHYPSDVIGGFFVSAIYLIIFTHCIFLYKSKKEV